MKSTLRFILVLITLWPALLLAKGTPSAKTDTIQPLQLLSPYFNCSHNHNNSNATFNLYIDSILQSAALTETEHVLLCHVKFLYNLEPDDFQYLIDSILDQDTISESFMLALDYCLALTYNNTTMPVHCIDAASDNTLNLYPASELYADIWCPLTSNPYPPELALTDSLVELWLCLDTSNFSMPCADAPVTSKYGWRDGRMHHGIDLGINYSLPIYAVFDGVVRLAKFYQGYGRLVIVRHYNGTETFYAHLSRINVKPGQKVNAGDVLGKAGNSGRSYGTHLHFEIRYKGIPLNPAHIISFKDNTLQHDKVILKKIKNNFFVYNEDAILYSVQSGDYLHRIATEYGTSVAKLCEANDISRNARLKVGQLLRIVL